MALSVLEVERLRDTELKLLNLLLIALLDEMVERKQ